MMKAIKYTRKLRLAVIVQAAYRGYQTRKTIGKSFTGKASETSSPKVVAAKVIHERPISDHQKPNANVKEGKQEVQMDKSISVQSENSNGTWESAKPGSQESYIGRSRTLEFSGTSS